MKTKKSILIVLALMIAACLSVTALAETAAEAPANDAASEAAKAAIEEAQAAADAAKADDTALNEALEAYSKAKTEKRKLELMTGLQEELDSYVAAGSLTREQADLILKYYAEQLTLQQGSGFGRGGRGGRGGHGGKGFGRGMNGGMNSGFDADSRNNGFGGPSGRFENSVPVQPQAPEAPAEQEPGNT